MEYNYFKPTEAMERAIREKDKDALKALLVGIIGSDPTFETTEFQDAFEYIDSNGISLNEPYVKQDGEMVTNIKEEWTKEYFGLNLVWLKDNFNLRQRIDRLKKVGSYVYRDTQTMGKMRKVQFEKKTIAVKTASGDENKWWLTAIISVCVVILVAVILFSF
jgi:hypothetical protein